MILVITLIKNVVSKALNVKQDVKISMRMKVSEYDVDSAMKDHERVYGDSVLNERRNILTELIVMISFL